VQINTKSFQTASGTAEGVQTKWEGFNLLVVTGSKGFLACPAIDSDACNNYGVAVGLIESSQDNPIGNLDGFAGRKVFKVNKEAGKLGISEGMKFERAVELIV